MDSTNESYDTETLEEFTLEHRHYNNQEERMAKSQNDKAELMAFIAQQQKTIDSLNEELAFLKNSRSWRCTKPLRAAAHKARALHNHVRTLLSKLRCSIVNRCKGQHVLSLKEVHPALHRSSSVLSTITVNKRGRIVLISGEPDTPGHAYRMKRLVQALSSDYQVFLYTLKEIDQHQNSIVDADLLWLWRCIYTDLLGELVRKMRVKGKHVIFDIDDLFFLPEIVSPKYMDFIRSKVLNEASTRHYVQQIQQMMREADMCVASTHALAQSISHHLACPCKVLPNSFDRATHDRALAARLKWNHRKADDFIRIGYAAGSPTHQADFRLAVPALISVLTQHSQARLVLFEGFITIDEFPELSPLIGNIEWRKRVPLECFADEMARFDINIVPLEYNNPFCNAKSELKFFEAALVNVPTIASPTQPYLRAIRHGENGFLASTTEEWENALNNLLDDATLRDRMGTQAYRDVLWTFGPEIKQHLGLSIADMFFASPRDKARVFVVDETINTKLPLDIANSGYEVAFSTGPALAKISVVMPLHNNSVFMLEALNSLLTQTMQNFDVVLVDDASTNNTLEIARNWLKTNADYFASITLLRNSKSSGLSLTRNAGIAYSHSEYIMLLNADSKLMPECLELCAQALNTTSAAIAYPTTLLLDDVEKTALFSKPWNPDQFRFTTDITTISMLRKAHWVALGGFTRQDEGWEDYDFWCKMAEHGFWGVHVPEAVAQRRMQEVPTPCTCIDKAPAKATLTGTMLLQHPWLNLEGIASKAADKKN